MSNSIVEDGASVASSCTIGYFVVVKKNAVVGEGTVLEENVVVEEGARIGSNCRIGVGSKIGKKVVIGNSTVVKPHSLICGDVSVGDECQIGPKALIGTPPQHANDPRMLDLKTGNIYIGNRVVIREFVNVHLPCGNETRICDDAFIMAGVNINHDVTVSSRSIIASNSAVGGTCIIFEDVFMGLGSTIHQYSTIGAGVMIAMLSPVARDIPPFLLYVKGAAVRLNTFRLNKLGYSVEQQEALFRFYTSDTFKKCMQDKAFCASLPDSDGWFIPFIKQFFATRSREICKILLENKTS